MLRRGEERSGQALGGVLRGRLGEEEEATASREHSKEKFDIKGGKTDSVGPGVQGEGQAFSGWGPLNMSVV